MISVIIPAHNEESVIGRLLGTITSDTKAQELEVIVICNGCTDGTALATQQFRGSIKIIETSIASKTHALNLGDAVARAFPRFYLDADVQITVQSLTRMTDVLRSGVAFAVSPRFKMDSTRSSWFVGAFYSINAMLPTSREGIGGSGVYGLSEAGRRRFGEFPNLTADDGFVRVQFRPHERITVDDCFSTVTAPRTLGDLIRIKTRSHYGTLELRRAFPALWGNRGPSNAKALRALLLKPRLWPKLTIYLFVKLTARWRANRQFKAASPPKWERDETSREIANAAVPVLDARMSPKRDTDA